MAAKSTTIYGLQVSSAGADWVRAQGVKVTGDVAIATCQYVTDGAEVSLDTINLVQLPVGARVIPHLCKIVSEAGPAGTFTAKIGDALDDDRYSTAVALAAGGLFDFAGATVGALEPYLLTDPTTVIATLTTVATPAASKKVTFYIAFTTEN